ncbi:MAG: hypothetical protein E6H10_17355 [Bacteroidetes bacterium]|nr:MAG: hypothetical protein E6H10_17355 [Bacteroidota bacterium]
MSGNPSTSTSGSKGKDKEPQEPPRLFYSKNTAEEFSRQLNDIFDSTRQQHTEVKEAIESGFTTLNESIAALTAAILGRERSPTPTVIPNTPVPRSMPDIDVTPPPEEEEPRLERPEPGNPRDPRYMPSQKHTTATLSPAPQRPLPIRELSVSPAPTQQGTSNDGRLPLSALLPRFKGHDSENVIFWLHEMECLFVMYNVHDKNKVYNATRYIDGEAQKFYMYLVTVNDGKVPTWKEFRHALISRYHHPTSREDILRHKLSAIQFKGTQRMTEYCEEFRALEAQIYDMAFADRLNNFLSKLTIEASLYIRNAANDTRDMEVIYRLARQWATNVRSTITSTTRRRIHTQPNHQPRLLRSIPAHTVKKPDKDKDKSESDEELDVMEITDGEDDITLHVNKAEMNQVTCYRCRRIGHFARDCKVRVSSQQQRRTFPAKRGKPVNNTIFATAMDANAYGFNDEKDNELYAYDYDDDRTYSPSHEETELERATLMHLAPEDNTDVLFTDYEEDEERQHLKV